MVPSTSDPEGDNSQASIDTIFKILSDSRRRAIIKYLSSYPENMVPSEDIVDHLVQLEAGESDRKSIEILCRHTHFPQLAESGLVEYDPDNRTIRLPREGLLDTIVTIVDELGG